MIAFRALRPAELDDWYAHCQSVFQEEDADYFRKHYERDPDAASDLIFVALDEDAIVSTVRVFARKVWISGRLVSMGGIGEVSTKPFYRRQGIAAALLDMAISAMEAEGMQLSILFGNAPLYSRKGWRFCDVVSTDIRADALPELPKGVAIRPFTEGDLPWLMGMYDLTAARMDGAIFRSEAYWRGWVLPHWLSPMVLQAEDSPVAYCAGSLTRDDPTRASVTEMAFAPQAEPLAAGMLRALAQTLGADVVRFPAMILPGIAGHRVEETRGMMCRLNLPFDGISSTDALVRTMANPGMFDTDHF